MEIFVRMVSAAQLYTCLALLAHNLGVNTSHFEICGLPAYLPGIQARSKLLLVFYKAKPALKTVVVIARASEPIHLSDDPV